MIKKVYDAVERWNMLNSCDGVLVGLSGGADSVSLLHVMHRICAEREIGLRAVHVNHCIRGEDALHDEMFCRELCNKLEIQLDVFTFDIPLLAKREGIGLEECGRKYRYESFEKISTAYNFRIATAHTLSDSTETVLLNIARGCGVAGLRGIPAVRDKIIRPLILASRDDIERYCADNKLEYVTDESNFDDTYSRNHVRLNIIPEFRRLNPDFLSAASRLMDCAALDEEYLETEARKAFDSALVGDKTWRANKVYTLPAAIKKRVLMRIIQDVSGKPSDFTHIMLAEEMLENRTGAVSLPCGKILCIVNGLLKEQCLPCASGEWSIPLIDTILLPDGRRLIVERVDCAEFVKRAKFDKYLFKSSVNCDIIKKSDVFVRNRRAGDFFSPSGRGVTKSLKKLFNEAHIEIEARGTLPMIELDGRIIWIEHFGPAEGFAATPDCECISIITLKP